MRRSTSIVEFLFLVSDAPHEKLVTHRLIVGIYLRVLNMVKGHQRHVASSFSQEHLRTSTQSALIAEHKRLW